VQVQTTDRAVFLQSPQELAAVVERQEHKSPK
jgi:hypothetical protein